MNVSRSLPEILRNRLASCQSVLLFIALFSVSPAFSQTTQKYHVLTGTYTNGKSKGIQVYSFDAKTGKMVFESETAISNPSFLCLSPDNTRVYAVSEDNGKEGLVSAFSFNSKTGELHLINSQTSGGIAPCYVSTDRSGKYAFVANYMSGTIAAYRILGNGSLSATAQIITNQGSSKNIDRQEHAHAHSAVISPDNKFLLTADLGTDKEMIYKLDTANHQSPLSPADIPFYKATDGSGPRHLVFGKSGKFAYLIQELTATVVVFKFSNGALTPVQTISLIPAGVEGKAGAADIHLSADGKFLYGTNRGTYNDISALAVNQTNGKLTYLSRQSSFGKTPRNFAISPEGNFVIIANQNSDDVFILPRNVKTGQLSNFIQKTTIGAPVCIKFVKMTN